MWKLIFSLFWLNSAMGNEVVLITYQEHSPMIQALETVLVRDFFIPKELIKKVQTEFECDIKTNAVLHLCLTKEQEMKFVDLDQKKVREVLGVFYEN